MERFSSSFRVIEDRHLEQFRSCIQRIYRFDIRISDQIGHGSARVLTRVRSSQQRCRQDERQYLEQDGETSRLRLLSIRPSTWSDASEAASAALRPKADAREVRNGSNCVLAAIEPIQRRVDMLDCGKWSARPTKLTPLIRSANVESRSVRNGYSASLVGHPDWQDAQMPNAPRSIFPPAFVPWHPAGGSLRLRERGAGAV